MSNDTEIFERTKKKFEETKKELGFKVSFEEVDGIFFISDAAANAGFVSEKAFSRQHATAFFVRFFFPYN